MSLKKFKMNLVMKKIITIGLALIMGVCLFCGCNLFLNNRNLFKVKDLGGTIISLNEENGLSEIINTKEQLINCLERFEVSWSDKPIWEFYDSDFFGDKNLIIYIAWVEGSNIERVVEKYYVENKTCVICVNGYLNGDTVNTDMFIFPIILEVDKADVTDVNTVKVEYEYIYV